MVKKELRKIYLGKRKAMPPAQLEEDSGRMLRHFTQLSLPATDFILSYAPLAGHCEFDVAACETVLLARNGSATITWPRLRGEGALMDAIPVDKRGESLPNRYNIPEPVGGVAISPLLIDLVLVPLLAFDSKGYRVGYGKGYYDRYLSLCRPDVIKIGFSFFESVGGIEDIDEFDVPLSYCITPMRVYEF